MCLKCLFESGENVLLQLFFLVHKPYWPSTNKTSNRTAGKCLRLSHSRIAISAGDFLAREGPRARGARPVIWRESKALFSYLMIISIES